MSSGSVLGMRRGLGCGEEGGSILGFKSHSGMGHSPFPGDPRLKTQTYCYAQLSHPLPSPQPRQLPGTQPLAPKASPLV